MKKPLFILFVLVPVLLSIDIQAQESNSTEATKIFRPHWNANLNGGITQYFGDLNEDNFFNRNIKGGFGAIIGYQFSPVIGVRGQFMKGNLYSEHTKKQLKLKSDIADASILLTVNINELISEYNPTRLVNFYLFGGGGLTSFTSTLTDANVVRDSTAARQTEFMIPVGAGAAFRLTHNISLNIEYADRILLKDRSLDLFTATSKRDQYSYTSAGISVSFGGPRDQDKDGIIDKKDLCPTIPGKIELSGCPDKDGDGIYDYEDDCPDVKGSVDFKGCPDTDLDGIPDKDDKCPAIAGKKEFVGCPDKDNDGVIDQLDNCPTIPGKKDLAGCPDKDGDGVIDKEDACPELPGQAKLLGCPDKDNDGVPDNKDKCPEVSGPSDNSGCPVQTSALVDEKVYFDTDKDIVIASYNQLLNKVAETLKDNPGIRLAIDGHTDSREGENYNLRLSEHRADYVIRFLTERGIDANRLVKSFYGETRPVADNSTEEGMRLNRRVEIKSIQ
jgi:OmpA-OmpF porin, OOP family